MPKKSARPSHGFKPIKATLLPKTGPYFFYITPNNRAFSWHSVVVPSLAFDSGRRVRQFTA